MAESAAGRGNDFANLFCVGVDEFRFLRNDPQGSGVFYRVPVRIPSFSNSFQNFPGHVHDYQRRSHIIRKSH